MDYDEYDLNKPSTLLILGNGFDLHCGLNSSFRDYFNSINKGDVKSGDDLWRYLCWQVYCDACAEPKRKSVVHWSDVESVILETMRTKKDLPNAEVWPYRVPIGVGTEITQLLNSKLRNATGASWQSDEVSSRQFVLQSIVFSHWKDSPTTTAAQILMEELRRFEAGFVDYLSAEVENKKETYLENAERFIADISPFGGNIFAVIFNYTNPFQSDPFVVGQVHVHGSLDKKDIIIGIDTSIIRQKADYIPNAYQFTKARRKLSHHPSENKLPSKEHIDRIIIYGHSLSGADYSYFFSIFNLYDLYSGSVELVFLYSRYNDDDTEAGRVENDRIEALYQDSVFSLLEKYASEAINPTQASSFLTKLQLEQRLSIMTLENYASGLASIFDDLNRSPEKVDSEVEKERAD